MRIIDADGHVAEGPSLAIEAMQRWPQHITPRADGRRAGTDPLRELDMRLTYRTIRVLLAVGELSEQGSHPSNREVADGADIRDQGQISKLLARLDQLGLVRNAADPRVKGEPNAWALTERGEEVRSALPARQS